MMNVHPDQRMIAPDCIDSPITSADWAGMSPQKRALLQAGIDELDRGAYITHADMKREFQRLREKYANK